jgi:hypothetical protein
MISLFNIIKEQQTSFDFNWTDEKIERYFSDILKLYDAQIISIEKENIFISFSDKINRQVVADTYNLVLFDDYTIEDDEYDDSNPYVFRKREFPNYFFILKKKSFHKIVEKEEAY